MTTRTAKPKPARKSKTITTTEAKLIKAFTEWDRRFREEPERFMNEAVRLLRETPESYGAACAPYLISILNERQPSAAKVYPS